MRLYDVNVYLIFPAVLSIYELSGPPGLTEKQIREL